MTQELHYRASKQVARALCNGESDRTALIEAAMPLADAQTDSARRRAATAVMTRLGLGRRRHVTPTGLHTLLSSLPEQSGRQLLTYVVARHEPMVRATAFDVLYPHFVERRTPEGLSAEEFSAANANGLFEDEGAITHAAVATCAKRQWGVTNSSTTRRILRVLRKGGVLGSAWISRSGNRCLGHFPVVRVPDIATFAYAMYAIAADGHYVRLDRLWSGLLVHLFMLRPVVVDYLLEHAEAAGLAESPQAGTAVLPYESLESAAAAILKANHAGR